MKLLLDEMISPAIAEQLRRRNHDVVSVSEREDLRSKSGGELFDVAQSEDRVVVTENIKDFRVIAANHVRRGGSHRGIICTPNEVFPRGDQRTIGRIVTVLAALLDDDENLQDREHWLRSP